MLPSTFKFEVASFVYCEVRHESKEKLSSIWTNRYYINIWDYRRILEWIHVDLVKNKIMYAWLRLTTTMS